MGMERERLNGWYACERSANRQSGYRYKPPFKSLSPTLVFFAFMLLVFCFALSERKSGEIRRLGSELSEQL